MVNKIAFACMVVILFHLEIFVVKSASDTQSSTSSATSGVHKGPRKRHHEPPMMPRYNLNLTKLSGQWYPIVLARKAANLWSEAFRTVHPNSNVTQETCFCINYAVTKDEKFDKSLSTEFSHGNLSMNVEATILIDESHPVYSKWGVFWPNGVNTLTSVAASGSLAKNQSTYTWLVIVDWDNSGIIHPEWAVLTRVGEDVSKPTIDTILNIVEGIRGLITNDTLSHIGGCSSSERDPNRPANNAINRKRQVSPHAKADL